MKQFKSIIVLFLTTIICYGITSCSKDDYTSPIKGKTVADLIFESSSSSQTITFGDSDLSGLSVSSSETWCVPYIQGTKLYVSVQGNDTYGERKAKVIISDPSDQTNVAFQVVQKQNNAILTDDNTYSIPEAGGDININVKSNVQYQVEIPSNALWLTQKVSTRALENSTITLSADTNTSGDEREATVKLTNVDSGLTSQISIKQELTPSVSIDADEFQIDETGGEIEVKVSSNIAIDIKFSDDWISSKSITENGNYGFVQKIKVASLPKGVESRTATVVFSDKLGKWNLNKTVTINQDVTPIFSIDKDEYQIGESGGEIEITGTSNLAFDVIISDNWISDAGASVKADNSFVQKIKISALPDGIENRNSTISLTPKNSKWNLNLEVSIKQINNLSIKESDIELLVGNSYSLNVVNNTGGSLSWKSANTSVASVDNNGKVTGIGKGTTTITAASADGKYKAQCSVSVKDITDFITARTLGGSIMEINGLIQYGSSLNWTFINNSSETVRLKSMQLVDGATGKEGNIMSVDRDVAGGSSVSYSTTIGLLGIHKPVTCRFRYEYKGKEYMTTAVFDSLW